MQITLLVPELLWPEPEDREILDRAQCPGLEKLLGRSRPVRRQAQSLEATLTDLFGLTGHVAYAAYRGLGEDPPLATTDSCWLCADPVHLRLHQERLILADATTLAIRLEEATAIVADFNRHFSDRGTFHLRAVDRWYLELPAETQLGRFDVLPLSVVAGRRFFRQLPENSALLWLRRLLNEAQMFLHGHAVNAQRERDGQSTINSLWLWGGGSLPVATPRAFSEIWGNSPLLRGLGRAAGVPVHPLPAQAGDWLAQVARGGDHLLALESLQAPVQYQDGGAWQAALTLLERNWFRPLQHALAQGRIRGLRIEALTAYATLGWSARRADQWKLWRRPATLAEVARALAAGGS